MSNNLKIRTFARFFLLTSSIVLPARYPSLGLRFKEHKVTTWGIAPDKLYSSWMVYDTFELLMKSLTVDQEYYFAVDAFNENGVSLRSVVKQVK